MTYVAGYLRVANDPSKRRPSAISAELVRSPEQLLSCSRAPLFTALVLRSHSRLAYRTLSLHALTRCSLLFSLLSSTPLLSFSPLLFSLFIPSRLSSRVRLHTSRSHEYSGFYSEARQLAAHTRALFTRHLRASDARTLASTRADIRRRVRRTLLETRSNLSRTAHCRPPPRRSASSTSASTRSSRRRSRAPRNCWTRRLPRRTDSTPCRYLHSYGPLESELTTCLSAPSNANTPNNRTVLLYVETEE